MTNALIVNFGGLGDGIIEAPFLMNMQNVAPDVRFHHTAGAFFRDNLLVDALGLRTFRGLVPLMWRKFARADWVAINDFIKAYEIELIINFRTLGPSHDDGYFSFKAASPSSLRFWNFGFDDPRRERGNIRSRIRDLLVSERVIDESVNSLALRNVVPRLDEGEGQGRRIAINMHSGNRLKLWPDAKWLELCIALSDQDYLDVFAGYGDEENCRAVALVSALDRQRPGRAQLIQPQTPLALLSHVLNASCVVSTDSWAIHAASAFGKSSIGLYVVTSAVTWGGGGDRCKAIESRHLRRCDRFDPLLGICRNDYVECPLLQKEGDGISVFDVLQALDSINTADVPTSS